MRNSGKFNRRQQGFTLIELLVVIVIIGILASIAITKLSAFRDKAKETQTASNLAEINRGLEACATDNNGLYPFRVRWFDNATAGAAGFDPYRATDTGSGGTSDAAGWFSLGLFGGVKVVDNEFADNTFTGPPQDTAKGQAGFKGMAGNKVIQPGGVMAPTAQDRAFYRRFNQYSDPLVALGYLDSYPENPFLKRPMGNIMYSYGDAADGQADWGTAGANPVASPTNYNSSIPHPNVFVTPGDFVYTFFYEGSGGTISDPGGVVEAKKSYQPKSNSMTDSQGIYYLDMVDSYKLWSYGKLPLNAGTYVAYPNNVRRLRIPGKAQAKKDWDGNGLRDMFELGIIQYFERGGSADRAARTNDGSKIEF